MATKKENKQTRKLALVIIDMQVGFLNNEKEVIIPNQLEVMNFYKESKIPLVVVETSKYGALHDSLENKINTLNSSFIGRFSKCEDNAFSNQQLDRYLRKLSIDTVLLTGINANACVLATALGALQHGYNITTSKDLIAGFGACSPSIIYSWFKTVGTLKNNYSELFE